MQALPVHSYSDLAFVALLDWSEYERMGKAWEHCLPHVVVGMYQRY